MSRAARFHYALEPVLLTRQWDLDALMLELAEQNAAIARQTALQDAVQASQTSAAQAWEEASSGGKAQTVDAFVIHSRYAADLARQAREHATRMDELVLRRDALIADVVQAKRGVEAAEQHRDEMKAQFVRQRLSGDFKVADDQWNTLQSGAATHDH
jgi:hypothetical protein